ncbi:MAG: DUF3179 domain-containing (seleno)protein [Nitrososphaerota archaeon]
MGFRRGRAELLSSVSKGVAKAYPNRILVWYEILNDVVAGEPLVITYVPYVTQPIDA